MHTAKPKAETDNIKKQTPHHRRAGCRRYSAQVVILAMLAAEIVIQTGGGIVVGDLIVLADRPLLALLAQFWFRKPAHLHKENKETHNNENTMYVSQLQCKTTD